MICNLQKLKRKLKLFSLVMVFVTHSFAQDVTARVDDQTFTSLKNLKQKNYRSLKDVLADLQGEYNVSIAYEGKVIENKLVDISKINTNKQNFEQTLNEILLPLGLTFVKVDQNVYGITRQKNQIKKLKAKESQSETGYFINNNNLDLLQNRALSINLEKKDITVRGRITAQEDGTGLPGVNVLVKGTSIGTTTDVNGDFSLNVPDGNATLVVSFIGYTTEEIEIGGRNLINIAMVSDVKQLSEVVVVGYGTKTKETLTGSISKVDGSDIKINPVPNISNSMAGRVPGIIAVNPSGQPGRDNATLLIRGRGTLGDNSPLFVIDGVAGRSGFERLDPNDIESISVLKDASAAIYGAQAANGVIIITTKRGKSGKPQLEYSLSKGWSQPTMKPEMANAYEYASFRNDYFKERGEQPEFTADQLNNMRTGADPDNRMANTDWWDEVVRKAAPMSRHNLNLSGGNENVKYFLSGGFLQQEGIFKNGASNFSQYNYRSNIDIQVTKDFKIGLDLSGRQETIKAPSAASQRDTWLLIFRTYPYLPARYSNGLPYKGLEKNWNPAVMGTDIAGDSLTRRGVYNSLITLKYDMPFIEGLSVDGFVAFDKTYQPMKSYRKPYTLYEKLPDGTYGEFNTTYSSIEAWERYDNTSVLTLNGRISYDKYIGDHSLNIFAAYEQNLYKWNWFSAYRRNFITASNTNLFAGGSDGRDNDGKTLESARMNYFGRISYGYKGKYLSDINFRYDGSQKFPKGKRFGFFPGVALAWRVSEEAFFQEAVPFMNNLKLRASWGQLGNDRVKDFQYMTSYNINGNSYLFGNTEVPGFTPGTTPNTDITWEVATNSNVAVEAGFLENMFTLEVDVFHSKRNNILTQRSAAIPDYTGLQLPDQNIAEMLNRGFEAVLTHNNKIGDLEFSIAGNYSFARNKVQFIDEAATVLEYQKKTGYIRGAELYYLTDGLFRTEEQLNSYPKANDQVQLGDIKIVDYNEDGVINAKDAVRMNKSTEFPEIMYGLTTTASFKGFDLNLLFQGAGNYYKYINTEDAGIRGNFLREFIVDRWSESNPDGEWPRAFQAARNSGRYTMFLKDASFLRLKAAEIGYSIPNALTSRLKIQNVRIFASGSNLFFVFNKLKYYDPEMSDDRFAYYPQQRIYNLGLSVRF